jgi:hypothetical protein
LHHLLSLPCLGSRCSCTPLLHQLLQNGCSVAVGLRNDNSLDLVLLQKTWKV